MSDVAGLLPHPAADAVISQRLRILNVLAQMFTRSISGPPFVVAVGARTKLALLRDWLHLITLALIDPLIGYGDFALGRA